MFDFRFYINIVATSAALLVVVGNDFPSTIIYEN